MISYHILQKNLNIIQYQIVTSPLKNILVLAGAGSGKTKVLIYRIAWLIYHYKIKPENILAVTFTNKAADEIETRMHQFNINTTDMFIGTFHSIAYKLLKKHYDIAQLNQDFKIIDSNSQLKLIIQSIDLLKINNMIINPIKVQKYINNLKDNILNIIDKNHILYNIYLTYEKLCKKNHLLDYSELLLCCYKLLQNNEYLRNMYQSLFHYLLIDEFQDINNIQYLFIKSFIYKGNSLLVVGDDDQSIYGWRGANKNNLIQLKNDYINLKTFNLEQNYRSTKTIITASNYLINHNISRLKKTLWTNGPQGNKIILYKAFNEYDEAEFIAKYIIKNCKNIVYSKIAILLRSNVQNKIIQEIFIKYKLPFKKSNHLSFFLQPEIKELLSYLLFITNLHDDISIIKIINKPSRGIGKITINKLYDIQKTHKLSLWESIHYCIENNLFSTKSNKSILIFIDLIKSFEKYSKILSLPKLITHIIEQLNLKIIYIKNKEKLHNILKLIIIAEEYILINKTSTLEEFICYINNLLNENTKLINYIQIMTIHTSKGLEFPIIFIAGMEDEIFPGRHYNLKSIDIEEERRLCYVGMTRTITQLIFTYATKRLSNGKIQLHHMSRFISEIPINCINQIYSP